MAVFKLDKHVINLLKAKFEEFQREREKMHGLIIDYIVDYRHFQGTPSERRDFLGEKYFGRAVNMSHLIYDDNLNEFYWQTFEIELLLGRSQSTISRTLSSMEKSEGWRSRLLALRKQEKSPNGNKIYVYKQGIFDLIFDHYEEEYLLRFARPRRGDKDKAPDMDEIHRFWNYLKDSAQFKANFQNQINQNENNEITELPDIPPMNLKEILSLMWQKAFNAKIMTVTSVIIAISFFIAYYFKYASYVLAAISFLTFTACTVILHGRKNLRNAEFLSDLGAVALLFTMSWGACILSQDYYYDLKSSRNALSLNSELSKERNLIFKINANSYGDIKEIFYKISPDKEFRSTGFNDFNYPNLIINPEKNKIFNDDFIEIDLKYTDVDGRENGTWHFSFNKNFERLRLSKNFFINDCGNWLGKFHDPHKIIVYIRDFNSKYADNIVKAVAYGINTDMPDKIFNLNNKNKRENIILNVNKSQDYKYITSYLIFSDGTSSDVIQRLDL